MPRTLTAALLMMLMLPISAATAQGVSQLKTAEERMGYLMGFRIGSQMKREGYEISLEALVLGAREAAAGQEMRLSRDEIGATVAELRKQIDDKRAAEAFEKGRAFLDQNRSADGVEVTASGLQYRIDKVGSGQSPTSSQTVTVHYEGRLLNGAVFDSSRDRGETASFPVNGVIAGWTEALQLMKPGGVWEVWIPSELAYGAKGAGDKIGPNEVLNFTIELIDVER